jgi:hypothetical protein
MGWNFHDEGGVGVACRSGPASPVTVCQGGAKKKGVFVKKVWRVSREPSFSLLRAPRKAGAGIILGGIAAEKSAALSPEK